MDKLTDVLAAIRIRPGMYLGKRSAILLQVFLQGWILGKEKEIDCTVMRDFQEWVAAKYKMRSSHSWARIVTFHSEDDADAFESFYDLFDEFLEVSRSCPP